MRRILEQAEDDWGVRITPQSSAWVASGKGKPLDSEDRYFRAVVQVLRKHDAPRIDDRLIKAVWRDPAVKPSEWAPQGRAWDWISYWNQAAKWPETVGSCHNVDPYTMARCWVIGIPSNLANSVPWYGLRSGSWTGQRRRILALWEISRKGGGMWTSGMKTADLCRMARLSGAFLRFVEGHNGWSDANISWESIAKYQEKYQTIPRQMLMRAGIPAREWGSWGNLPTEEQEGLREAAAVGAAVPALGRRIGLRVWKDESKKSLRVTRAWSKLLKDGLLGKMLSLSDDDKLAMKVAKALGLGWTPNPEDWGSCALLEESIDDSGVLGVEDHGGKEREVSRRSRDLRRSLDRAAQRRPQWAIKGWSYEYQRGCDIAAVMKSVIEHLSQVTAPIVVLGRDGEMIHHLLLRAGIASRYVLASRSLTTHHGAPSGIYLEYLKALVPQGAYLVDTGFSGSIPDWFQKNGWELSGVGLVSSVLPHRQIPIPKKSVPAKGLREMVLADLEHASQRLSPISAWGRVVYSAAAPGYWARLYGVCDTLGLPRSSSHV